MGDENTVLSTDEVRHVLRRTGFGAPPKALDKLLDSVDSPTRGAIADSLLEFRFRPKLYKPGGRDFDKVHNNWVKYLLNAKSPLQEKLVLFWHDHFATSAAAVGNMMFMALQIQLLHLHAAGNFRDLMKAINTNAAMMEMLDTVRNNKEIPNENYARELQELFTLGVYDLAGQPTYTQDDIVQIARAFTGWLHNRPEGNPFLRTERHDFMANYPARGPKVIYTTTGGFGPGGADFTVNGEGEAEIDTVIDIILSHQDSQGQNTVARRLAQRLLEYFCHGAFANPGAGEIAIIDDIVADSGFASSWDIAALCRLIFVHDVFFETAAPAPYGPSTKKSVKWPIDYFVTTMRLTGMKLKGSERYIPGGTYQGALNHMTNMGQVLLAPPSVFGWNWETAWLSSSTLLARYNLARDIIAAREGGSGFRPDRLIDLALTDPDQIVQAVSEVLGVSDQIPVGSNERQILVDYLTDNGTNPTLDLNDEFVRNTKLHGLFGLVIQSPAYQLH